MPADIPITPEMVEALGKAIWPDTWGANLLSEEVMAASKWRLSKALSAALAASALPQVVEAGWSVTAPPGRDCQPLV